MMVIRRSRDRGQADHGWLQSKHSFSFANYYDPHHMGFGHLRVINQDVVAPGQGFGTHPHRNMEIISYVVRGALEHKDTLGTGSVIRPGEVQLMSAGRGIAHSEFNASTSDEVEFLQIWILPRESGGEPGYQQTDFGSAPGLTLVVSPDGREGSLRIKQRMELYRLLLTQGSTSWTPSRARAWVQVVRGELLVDGVLLQPGDGLQIDATQTHALSTDGDVEALLFDLQ